MASMLLRSTPYIATNLAGGRPRPQEHRAVDPARHHLLLAWRPAPCLTPLPLPLVEAGRGSKYTQFGGSLPADLPSPAGLSRDGIGPHVCNAPKTHFSRRF